MYAPSPASSYATRRRGAPRTARVLTATLSALLLGVAPLAAQLPGTPPPGTTDSRPTVAVLYFTNSALVGNAEYAPLSKGMAEMLITELAQNPGVRVVERDRLQTLLEEQNLGSSDRVDKESAVRIGKTLGAHHLLMGSFVIDQKQNVRIDVRAVNTETSAVEYVESITGKADRMLAMVGELGTKVNAGLKLPPMPVRAPSVRVEPTGAKGPNQLRSMMLMSRALEQEDRGNPTAAVALYKQALDANPQLGPAKVRLASIETGSGAPRTP